MRKRPPGRHMSLAASSLLLLFVIHTLGACDVPPSASWTRNEPAARGKGRVLAQVAPERYSNAPGRFWAALEDLALEAARVESAWQRFALDLFLRPELPDVYVVSFQDPVPLRTLLESPMAEELMIETFYVWLLAEGATTPDTGHVSADTVGWPSDGPRAVAGRMQGNFLDYLSMRERGLGQIRGEVVGEDPGFRASLQRQAAQARQLQTFVRKEGLLLSGFRCMCPPLSLLRLMQTVPSIRLRAVEEWPAVDSPIHPRDPLRDRVIATRGRYGI